MGLFGKEKAKDPKEQVREWRSKFRKQDRELDRQIRQIEAEELKIKRSIKELAKKGDKENARKLAGDLVHSRQAKSRIYTTKAHINSVVMQMQQQVAQLRVMGALQKSTKIMQSMARLVRVPELQQTMMELEMEMTKAGVIEEMTDDLMEGVLDDEPISDSEESAALDAVLHEITNGAMGVPAAGTSTTTRTASTSSKGKAPAALVAAPAPPSAFADDSDEDEKAAEADLEKRVAALAGSG